MTQADQPRVRYRIRFGKRGALRYTSHLDVVRMWERALRRAGAPLHYSQGYNPRPQMQVAAGLPLGIESTAEVMDIWLDGPDVPEPGDLLTRLRATAPAGLTIEAVSQVDLGEPALQTLTRSAEYRAVPGEDIDAAELRRRAAELLAQESIPRKRRKKSYDLRPLVRSLDVLPGTPPALRMDLSLSQDDGTGRPDEALDALGLDPLAARVTRTAIHFADPD